MYISLEYIIYDVPSVQTYQLSGCIHLPTYLWNINIKQYSSA